MSLQFGRCGSSDGVTLGEHSSFTLGRAPKASMTNGQKVAGEDDGTGAGWITATSQADANALRQQFLGHFANLDEPQVPFIWGTDPTQNGYWVPITGDAETVLGVSHTSGGGYGFHTQWKAQRAAAYSAPRFQSRVNGNFLTNAFGVVLVNTNPWHAVPAAATGYNFEGRGDVYATRTGPGGTVNFFSTGTSYIRGNPSFYLPPANYYDMAATIKVGNPARTVSGRQNVSAGNEAQWEISNGLVKITAASSGTSMLKFYMPVYATPANWGTPVAIDVGYLGFFGWTTHAYTQIDSVSIRRNSPECCVLRLNVRSVPNGANTTNYFTVDIMLRRGDRTARLTIKSPIATKWGIGATAATGTTNVTYGSGTAGIRRTAADGDGNKFCFFTGTANTQDNPNARIYATSNTMKVDMAISGEVGGASAVAPDDSSSLIFQYYAAQYEFQRVIRP